MLPYPSSHHFFIPQEAPHPNPTGGGGGGFPPMPEQQHYVADHFFPGQYGGQHFNSETLEAVLRPTARAAPDPASAEAPPPPARNGAGGGRARKRPFRTDRHSKIRTAQGVRDRRMRLSLDVARDFFALQDRLGFDKASKTVDWLLTQSKPAIDRLSDPSAGALSPTSAECGGDHRLDEAAAAVAGSGKREGVLEKARARSGTGSMLALEHGGYELNHVMSAAAPMIEEYYYDLGEMMSSNGCEGDGDDDDDDDGDGDGDYEEDGAFLDGMQY